MELKNKGTGLQERPPRPAQHQLSTVPYLRPRDEIEISTDRFGELITIDSSGMYEKITIESAEGE